MSITSTSQSLLECKNISITFNNINILTNIKFLLAKGEFVSILGPSGCGKTTLLRIISGFETPSIGKCHYLGKQIFSPTRKISLVTQEYSLFPWLTAQKNIEIAFDKDIYSRKERKNNTDELLNLMELSAFAKHYPSQLSGGMRQRIAIARSLATEPDILLMDEAFGSLDEQTRWNMRERLLNIWNKFGITIVFITHNIEEAIFLSNRIIILTTRPGQIYSDTAIDLPYPRTSKMLITEQFKSIEDKIRHNFRLAILTSLNK